MKKKKILVNTIDNKDTHDLLNKILENCNIDVLTGKFL